MAKTAAAQGRKHDNAADNGTETPSAPPHAKIRRQVDMDIRLVKPAAHNPQRRTEEEKGIRSLFKSVSAIGLLYPILVTKDYQVIDGHRRLTVCKKLGYKSIPAIVVEEEDNVTADTVYADVNSNQKRMTGNDNLGIWLRNPGAVTPRTRLTLETIEGKIGRRLLQELYNQGMSHHTYKRVVQLANYCDRATPDFIRKALVWAMRYEAAGQIDRIVRLEASPAVIVKAVLEMKPVKLQLTVE